MAAESVMARQCAVGRFGAWSSQRQVLTHLCYNCSGAGVIAAVMHDLHACRTMSHPMCTEAREVKGVSLRCTDLESCRDSVAAGLQVLVPSGTEPYISALSLQLCTLIATQPGKSLIRQVRRGRSPVIHG